ALAQELAALGFRGIKFAAAISQQSAQQGSHQSVVDEMRALRRALGDEIEIMVDLHWKYTPTEAITLIRALEPYRPYFAEAPCAPPQAWPTFRFTSISIRCSTPICALSRRRCAASMGTSSCLAARASASNRRPSSGSISSSSETLLRGAYIAPNYQSCQPPRA